MSPGQSRTRRENGRFKLARRATIPPTTPRGTVKMPSGYETWLAQIDRDDRWVDASGTTNLTWGPVPSFMYGGEVATPFAPGEEIGIRDYSVSVGQYIPGPVNRVGSTQWPTVGVSTMGWPSNVVPQSQPTAARIPASVDPYPDYEGPVTPESHPELFEAPEYIPTPREQYEAAVVLGPSPPVLIPLGADDDPYEPERSEPVASFWDTVSNVVDYVQGQPIGGGVPQTFAPTLAPPVSVPLNIPPTSGVPAGYYRSASGALCKKRRRRRRLLTESDFNDLMRIATLPNKQNVTVALAKAVGRR